MANPEHVALVRKGSEAIAEWLRSNPGARLDLSGADLVNAKLSLADLSEADLSSAHVAGADLFQAKLSGANLTRASLFRANLRGANLAGAALARADLFAVVLLHANLSGADLSRANLSGADLSRADLGGANLSEAHLIAARLHFANVGHANLTGANLALASLLTANLTRADLSEVNLRSTSLSNLDLGQVIGLATVAHVSPSSVGVDTLIRSFRGAGNRLTPELEAFFRGAGVPHELLEALPRIVAEVKYYSCFIAYGQPDVEFARKVTEELRTRGVSCWLYDMDATVGERTWGEIIEKRRGAEKTVVLCSSKALVRDGVLKEIEEQIDEDPDKLVPVSLDDLWREKGFKVMRADNDLKPELVRRNWADFAGWKKDAERYQKGLEELLRGLRRKRVRRRRA